jgi:predicted secreted protein
MSNCYAGKDGALGVSTDGGATYTNIAMLTSWDVSQSAETLECAYMGTSWKENHAGMLSWEGSAEANFTDTAAATGLSGLAANAVTIGQSINLYFYPDSTDADLGWTGSAIVTSIDNSASLGDIQTVSLSFTGSGALVQDITV